MVDQEEMIDLLHLDCSKSFDYLRVTPINEQKKKKNCDLKHITDYSHYIT